MNREKELVSLCLWSIRRLNFAYQAFAYQELEYIIGEDNELLECAKQDIKNAKGGIYDK